MRAVSIVCLTGLLAAPQSSDPFRITSAKESKFQEEIDRAVADGYRLVHGNASVQLAIWERASDSQRRSYVFVADVETDRRGDVVDADACAESQGQM